MKNPPAAECLFWPPPASSRPAGLLSRYRKPAWNGAMMAADRRSSGAYVEDEGLRWKVQNRIAERFGDRVHVNATSFNRNVLPHRRGPDDAVQMEADRIAASVPNVRAITNDLQIAGIASDLAQQ